MVQLEASILHQIRDAYEVDAVLSLRVQRDLFEQPLVFQASLPVSDGGGSLENCQGSVSLYSCILE